MQLKDILNYYLYSLLHRDAVIINKAWYIVMFLANVVNDNRNDILIFRLWKVSNEIYDNVLSAFYRDRQQL